MDHNVFWNVYIFKTGVGTTGIVRADSLAEASEKVADMTRECVTMVVRASNIENSDYGVAIFDEDLLDRIK